MFPPISWPGIRLKFPSPQLGWNPLVCDCRLCWVKEAFYANRKSVIAHSYLCRTGPNKNKQWKDLSVRGLHSNCVQGPGPAGNGRWREDKPGGVAPPRNSTGEGSPENGACQAGNREGQGKMLVVYVIQRKAAYDPTCSCLCHAGNREGRGRTLESLC